MLHPTIFDTPGLQVSILSSCLDKVGGEEPSKEKPLNHGDLGRQSFTMGCFGPRILGTFPAFGSWTAKPHQKDLRESHDASTIPKLESKPPFQAKHVGLIVGLIVQCTQRTLCNDIIMGSLRGSVNLSPNP